MATFAIPMAVSIRAVEAQCSTNTATSTAAATADSKWKLRMRSRIANRRMSVIGFGSAECQSEPLESQSRKTPKRRVSLAVLPLQITVSLENSIPTVNTLKTAPTNSTLLSKNTPKINTVLPLPKFSTVETSPIVPNVMRVPLPSLPLESFLEASNPPPALRSSKLFPPKWQFGSLESHCFFSPNFYFALHSLIAKIQTMSAVLKIFNRNLMDLRILVNLLLILAIFSHDVDSAVLKSNCKKVGYQHIIDEPGCDLVAVYLNRCSGYCSSFSFPDPHQDNKVVAFAKCCRMTDVELIDVKVNCGDDGGVRTVKVPSARECGCFDCAA